MKQRTSRIAAATAALALAGATLFVGAVASQATNIGTRDGNDSDGCNVVWNSAVTWNPTLKNDDPEYPGLMEDFGGKQVDWTNGGYIESVSPHLNNGPGFFEIEHFTGAGGWDPTTYQVTSPEGGFTVWRIPIASDYTVENAKLVFTLPEDVKNTTGYLNDVLFSRLPSWSPTFAKYRWENNGYEMTKSDDGRTFTIDLGTLPAGTGTMFEFKGYVPTGSFMNQNRVGTSQFTGTYLKDQSTETCVTPVETATPVPTETPTPEPTETATPVPTETATPTPTETATPVPTETGTATATPVPTATATSTAPATAVPTPPAHDSDLAQTGAEGIGFAAAAAALALAGGAAFVGRKRRNA